MVVSLLVAGVVGGVTIANCWWAQRQRLTQPQTVSQVLLVMPDDIRANGSLIMGTGVDQDSGQRESFTYRARTAAERHRLSSSASPVAWQVSGTAQPLLPATNDHQFDSRFYYQQRRIYNELRIKQVTRVIPRPATNVRQTCHVIRYRLGTYFKTLPAPLAGYCQQLVIGNNDGDNQELTQAVKRLGIIHLFCISGMHIILLTSLVRWLGAYLWLEREWMDRFLLVGLPLYLIIGGGSTSLVRAVLMAEVALCQDLLKLDALDGWGISLIVGLVWNPFLLFNLGGQLSYLLSLTLQALARDVQGLKQCWLLSLLSLPALLYHVFEFHLLSLVASYVMIPLFSMVIFPAVIISAATYWLFPLIAGVVNSALVLAQQLLSWCARLPGEVHFGKPAFLCALLLFLLTVWLVEEGSWRRLALLLAAYCSCFLLIHLPVYGEVTFIDIGQGDSILIRTPFNRRTVLIDTGGKVTFNQPRWAQMTSRSDLAQRVTVNYLKSCGIHRLDTIYLSHHDADHIGYLPTLLTEMRVDRVVVPAGMEKQAAFVRRLQASRFRGRVLPVTDQVRCDPDLRIVHPFIPGQAQNEDSLVLSGTFGGQRFLFTGDLDRPNELAILARYPQLRADILKLGHHGSKTASDPRFLRQLQVKWGIVSAGRFNRYHHPSDEVVAQLRAAGIRMLSTQQYGMIKYRYSGHHGQWQTTLKGDEIRWTLPNSLNN